LAGFQVTLIGRFWVTAEDTGEPAAFEAHQIMVFDFPIGQEQIVDKVGLASTPDMPQQ
jgi:hypothetical protein